MSARTRDVGKLSVVDHSRDVTKMGYVYPVVSRRAGGVSVGINLNPNNACNWRCVYCQVENLVRGKAPRIQLDVLEAELGEMLDAIVRGDFLERSAPEGARRLNDIAFSGNGEPTSSAELGGAVDVAVRALERFELLGTVKLVLITNGSLMHRQAVLDAVRRMAGAGGEVWFKLDSATAEGARRINGSTSPPEEHLDKLRASARACPTWVQTCWFSWRGAPPSEGEQLAYLSSLRRLVAEGVPLAGVHLYTLARPSQQPEAAELSALPGEWLEERAERIRALGLTVKVSA